MSSYGREIRTASIDTTRLTVALTDGFAFTVPLTFYPRSCWPPKRKGTRWRSALTRFIGNRWTATSASKACCKAQRNIRSSPGKLGNNSNDLASFPNQIRLLRIG